MSPRFEKNAPGDFYIEKDCCITCGVMHDEAPGLISWHDFGPNEQGYVSSHCYVVRQPSTPDEIAWMLNAMNAADVDCLRYAGEDPDIIQRISDIGLAESCDLTDSNSNSTDPSRGD